MSSSLLDYPAEAARVVAHLDVVEEDVGGRALREHRGQLFQFALLVLVPPAAAAMQAEVALAGRDRTLAERVCRVPELQLFAQLFDQLARPAAARLPREDEPAALRLFEEAAHVLDVLARRLEAGRALEEDGARLERSRALARHLPGVSDGLRRPEEARSLPLLFVERALEPPVGRARREVRDELPRLERELEAGGRLLAPAPQRGDLRRLVEGVLHLDRVEQLVIRLARRAEAAAPDPHPTLAQSHEAAPVRVA